MTLHQQRFAYFGRGFFCALADSLHNPSHINADTEFSLRSIAGDGYSVIQCRPSGRIGHYEINFPFIRELMTLSFDSVDARYLAQLIAENRTALVNCVSHYTLQEFAAYCEGRTLYSAGSFNGVEVQPISRSTYSLWWDYILRSLRENPAKFQLSDFLSIGQDLALYRDEAQAVPVTPLTGPTLPDYVASCFRELNRRASLYTPHLDRLTSPHFWRATLTYPRTAAVGRTEHLYSGIHLPPTDALISLLLHSGRALDTTILWSHDFYRLIDTIKDPVCPSHTFLLALSPHYTLLLVRPLGNPHCFDIHGLHSHTGESSWVGHLNEDRYLQWDLDLLSMLGGIASNTIHARQP